MKLLEQVKWSVWCGDSWGEPVSMRVREGNPLELVYVNRVMIEATHTRYAS